MAHCPPRDEVSLEMDETLAIGAPLNRTFWSEPPQFEHIDVTEYAADEEQRRAQFEQFAQMQRINFPNLFSAYGFLNLLY